MAESSNPFSSFFSSAEAVEQQKSSVVQQRCEIGRALTRVFLCTPSNSVEGHADRPRFVVSLPQLSRDQEGLGKSGDLDLDTLTQGVVERLQMADPSPSLVQCQLGRNSGLFSKLQATETSNLSYLAHCYARACEESKRESKVEVSLRDHVVEECKRVVVEMCSPVLARHVTGTTFTDLVLHSIQSPGSVSVPIEFFYRIAEFHASSQQKLQALFEPALLKVYDSCDRISLSSPNLPGCLSVLEEYCRHSDLAKVVVRSRCWLPPNKVGKSFENQTLIGRLLSPTSVAPSRMQPSPHFPMDLNILNRIEVEGMMQSVQSQLEFLTTRMHKVFDGLLRSGVENKNALISWLVECLENNQDRGKMMSRLLSVQNVFGYQMTCASDGFFLNLGWVMLRLAAPFVREGDASRSRLSVIDPLYCATTREQAQQAESGGRILSFASDTGMAPAHSDDEASSSPVESTVTFNFITHCFFLTHKSLILGMSQVMQNFGDLMRVYGRSFQALESITRSGVMTGPLYQRIHTQFKLFHSQVQGCKAHMGHPQLQELSLMFHAKTAQWLVWLATQGSHDLSTLSHDPETLFPLPKTAPVQMRTVPECLVDNMAHFITYLGRSQSDILSNNTQLLSHLITFATVFMGSPQYIRNPHLRANIAQLVSLMIPRKNAPEGGLIPSFSDSQRALFETHKVACAHLIRVLMRIFVDIEFTGDSMEFEAKFQYRLPMYEVLKFVWVLPSYHASVECLSREAVQYDGSEQEIPTLLRFINMLINDATVQLDEGLENLVKIGELQKEKKSEEWQSYTDEQKKEHQQKLAEATQMASNRNQLAGYTVEALELITRDVQEPFVLSTMVDRIAAMLNYVLKQLVGPKRRQLNVGDMEKFHFHPKELVHKLVSIYVNLGQRSEFCHALPQDGRSFSLSLMEEAVEILRALGHGELMGKMQSLIERVRKSSEYLHLEETALDNAPEEFLDPVTNELMREPVRLPTSGVTMDKPNVIRHLLSDSTDPFNRSPLTADMLEPDHDLKQKIEDWRTQKLAHLRRSLQ